MTETWLVGVDGGGTRCRVRVRTRSGDLVGEAEGGSANIFTDPDNARRTIVSTAVAALAQGGVDAGALAHCHAGLGLAGANLAQAARGFDASSLPFASTILKSDAIAACIGAMGGEEGGIAILGTGSAYAANVGGRDILFGGWGLAVSDGASGADLGRAALAATLMAHDAMAPASALTRAVMARFGGGAAEIADFAGRARPVDFGTFCPLVWDHADARDPVASTIVQARVAEVEAGLHRLLALGARRLSLLGGQAARYQPRLGPELAQVIVAPRADAVEGALFLARQSLDMR